MFQVRSAAASRRGPLHARNEDSWCIHRTGAAVDTGGEGDFLFAVSDGVSTSGAGDLASTLTCQRLGDFIEGDARRSLDALVQLVNEIDWELRGEQRRAACTISVVWLHADVAEVVTVGDSPVYLLRGDAIERVSTVVPSSGKALGAYLGMGPGVHEALRTAQIKLRADDVLLLVTDGISDVIDDDCITAEWLRTTDPTLCAQGLVTEAARAGVEDDATALVVQLTQAPGLPRDLAPTDAPDPPNHLVDDGPSVLRREPGG